MATKQYSALDLQRLPVLGLRLENRSSAPSTPNAGDLYYDTTLGYPVIYNGSAWVKAAVTNIVDADISSSAAIALSKLATNPLARANHTGTQTASTISDFDTQVRISRLDQLAAPTSAVGVNAQRLTNVGDPSTPTSQDAATANWVTNQLASVLSGQDWKSSVKVRVATNVTVASPGATLDGVSMTSGDRVLLTAQTAGTENGIWVWNGAAAAMTRASDANSSTNVTSGMTVPVEQGTSADTIWLLTTDGTITVGTTSLAYTIISGAGAYTAGTGLTLTGNTFSLSTPVALANGGTNSTTAAGARGQLVAAQRGFNTSTHGAMTAGAGLAIAHGLATAALVVQVYENATGNLVSIDTTVDATNITLTSAVALAANTFRVVAATAV